MVTRTMALCAAIVKTSPRVADDERIRGWGTVVRELPATLFLLAVVAIGLSFAVRAGRAGCEPEARRAIIWHEAALLVLCGACCCFLWEQQRSLLGAVAAIGESPDGSAGNEPESGAGEYLTVSCFHAKPRRVSDVTWSRRAVHGGSCGNVDVPGSTTDLGTSLGQDA